MTFDYFYGEQSDMFAFYRIPKVLITADYFLELSTNAKLLYGLLLDRVSLSSSNGWFDEQGRVYIIYTIASIQRDLHCGDKKATRLLAELEKWGLIERKRQGQGKPTVIYVKNFLLDGMTCSEVQKREVKTSLKGNSRVTNFGSQESQEMNPNNTNINNTELNNTDSNLILSVTSCKDTTVHSSLMGSDEIDVNAYARIVRRNLEIDLLIQNSPFEEETFEGIYELVLETVISQGDSMIIGSNRYPMSLIRSKFLKLNSSHVEYVMDSLKANTTKVRNIKKYMLATTRDEQRALKDAVISAVKASSNENVKELLEPYRW